MRKHRKDGRQRGSTSSSRPSGIGQRFGPHLTSNNKAGKRSLWCARSLLSGCKVGKGSWWGGRCGLEGSGGLAWEHMVKWEEEGKRVQEYLGVGTNRYEMGRGCLKVRQTSGKLPALVPALACRMSQGQRAQHEREHWFQEKRGFTMLLCTRWAGHPGRCGCLEARLE